MDDWVSGWVRVRVRINCRSVVLTVDLAPRVRVRVRWITG